ncbi:flagellar hook assembly protein FlgD [Clostridium lundense]|uniref:flagellar hook assembly protein FlgD n=1 Tax=Clostridium lundense TaxID=319475 RepID=UPI000687A24E|nr:flagellar hook capping FlgD N-terminal domain-containing protein [Clostridium lundense]
MADSSSTIQKTSAANPTKTPKGTRIVKPGEELDKNAFFKILAAELSHQDPTNAKDGTEFVAQMAQFSSLEQMANLNSSMKFMGASSLVGKTVMVNKINENGTLYSGKVTGVSKDGDTVMLNIAVGEKKDENGNTVPDIKKFRMEDVIELIDKPNDNNNASGEDTNNKPEAEKPEENKDVQV